MTKDKKLVLVTRCMPVEMSNQLVENIDEDFAEWEKDHNNYIRIFFLRKQYACYQEWLSFYYKNLAKEFGGDILNVIHNSTPVFEIRMYSIDNVRLTEKDIDHIRGFIARIKALLNPAE